MSMSVVEVDQRSFEKEVLGAQQPVLVDFYSPTCGPCRRLSPVIDQIAAEEPEVKVCKIDVEKSNELAWQYKVMSVPTLVVFRKGEPAVRSTGVITKEQIKELLLQAGH